jgi:hypothetical protein
MFKAAFPRRESAGTHRVPLCFRSEDSAVSVGGLPAATGRIRGHQPVGP